MYLDPVCNSLGSFRYLPHEARLQKLLSNLEQKTCKFIALSLDLRQFLTANPKNLDWGKRTGDGLYVFIVLLCGIRLLEDVGVYNSEGFLLYDYYFAC